MMRISIKYKLTLLFLVTSVIPIILLGGFAYIETYNALHQSEEDRMRETVKGMANAMETSVEDTEGTLKNLAKTPSIRKILNDFNKTGKITDPDSFREVTDALRDSYVDAGGIYENMLVVAKNGRVIADSWQGKARGLDLSGRDYFQKAIRERRLAIGDVTLSDFSKTSIKLPVISMAYPVMEQTGQVAGVVVIAYDLSYFTRHLNQNSYGRRGFGYLVNAEGLVLYHPEKNKTLKPSNFPVIREILADVKSDIRKYQGIKEFLNGREEFMVFYKTVPKSKWVVMAFVSKDEYFAAASRIRTMSLYVIGASGLFSLLIGALLVRGFTRSLNQIMFLLKKVEEGNFTVKAKISTGDEFEELAASYNTMVDQKNLIIKKMQDTAKLVDTMAVNLNESVEQIKADMEQVTGVTQEVSAGAEANDASVRELGVVMNQIVEEVNSIKLASEQAVENSRRTTALAVSGEESVENAVRSLEEIEKSTVDSAISLKELYEAIDQIMNFVKLIKTIAQETNLLALNAAIEAAQAGENGRSFSVVAERIKYLAEESNGAAKEINNIIENIQEREENLLKDMGMVSGAVKRGMVLADRTVENLKDIITEINKNDKIVESIMDSVREQSHSVEEIALTVENIGHVTAETTRGTGFIAESTHHETAVLSGIYETSRQLMNMAQELAGMVAHFKLAENGALEEYQELKKVGG
jgi:methyl-accepting chemotaxis protein